MMSEIAETAETAAPRHRPLRWISLYGPLILALYFVATVRWGSFLLPGPPYIGDLVLGGLIIERLWALRQGALPQPLLSRLVTIPALFLLLLTIAQLATGPYTVDALRDAAPYGYAVLVLFGQSYRQIPERIAERLVFGALLIVAIAYAAVDLFPSLGTQVRTLGDDAVFLLQPRGDIDGALIGVLAALALDRVINGRTPLISALVGSAALVIVLSNQSRSALVACASVFGFLIFRYVVLMRRGERPEAGATALPGLRMSVRANALLAAGVLIFVPAGVLAVSGSIEALDRSINAVRGDPEAPASRDSSTGDGPKAEGEGDGSVSGNRSRGTPGAVRPVTEYAANTGVGTFKARRDAWDRTIDWIHEGPDSRAAFGIGFGPHYMRLSGADVLLFNEVRSEVRSVHNFAVNTWARLGGLGLLLLAIIAIPAIIAALRLSWQNWRPPILDLFAGLLVVAIPVTALFGVVLESPFGAIPYFWATGYLAARMVEEGFWKPLPLPKLVRSSSPDLNRPHFQEAGAPTGRRLPR